jgi:hypothetical protein
LGYYYYIVITLLSGLNEPSLGQAFRRWFCKPQLRPPKELQKEEIAVMTKQKKTNANLHLCKQNKTKKLIFV